MKARFVLMISLISLVVLMLFGCDLEDPSVETQQDSSAFAAPDGNGYSVLLPDQPPSGPGGSDYRHASVDTSTYGEGENQYWIFEPASPTPGSAPLIVINHGFWGMDPKYYGGWIEHLVRKGNIVVYPRYQTLDTLPRMCTYSAINAVKNAIQQLSSGGHVTPELDKFAIVGHSFGGGITVNMAVQASFMGLPKPKAIMIANSASGSQVGWDVVSPNLQLIPATTLMLIITGEEDVIAGNDMALQMFYRASRVPLRNKDFVTIFSDRHGEPHLLADHFGPAAMDDRYELLDFTNLAELIWKDWIEQHAAEHGISIDFSTVYNGVNALDYYCYWKLFDGLTDAAFYGKNREYALGNTPEQRFMGSWSDGTPVKELGVTKTP